MQKKKKKLFASMFSSILKQYGITSQYSFYIEQYYHLF